mgnify:FL=1
MTDVPSSSSLDSEVLKVDVDDSLHIGSSGATSYGSEAGCNW